MRNSDDITNIIDFVIASISDLAPIERSFLSTLINSALIPLDADLALTRGKHISMLPLGSLLIDTPEKAIMAKIETPYIEKSTQKVREIKHIIRFVAARACSNLEMQQQAAEFILQLEHLATTHQIDAEALKGVCDSLKAVMKLNDTQGLQSALSAVSYLLSAAIGVPVGGLTIGFILIKKILLKIMEKKLTQDKITQESMIIQHLQESVEESRTILCKTADTFQFDSLEKEKFLTTVKASMRRTSDTQSMLDSLYQYKNIKGINSSTQIKARIIAIDYSISRLKEIEQKKQQKIQGVQNQQEKIKTQVLELKRTIVDKILKKKRRKALKAELKNLMLTRVQMEKENSLPQKIADLYAEREYLEKALLKTEPDLSAPDSEISRVISTETKLAMEHLTKAADRRFGTSSVTTEEQQSLQWEMKTHSAPLKEEMDPDSSDDESLEPTLQSPTFLSSPSSDNRSGLDSSDDGAEDSSPDRDHGSPEPSHLSTEVTQTPASLKQEARQWTALTASKNITSFFGRFQEVNQNPYRRYAAYPHSPPREESHAGEHGLSR